MTASQVRAAAPAARCRPSFDRCPRQRRSRWPATSKTLVDRAVAGQGRPGACCRPIRTVKVESRDDGRRRRRATEGHGADDLRVRYPGRVSASTRTARWRLIQTFDNGTVVGAGRRGAERSRRRRAGRVMHGKRPARRRSRCCSPSPTTVSGRAAAATSPSDGQSLPAHRSRPRAGRSASPSSSIRPPACSLRQRYGGAAGEPDDRGDVLRLPRRPGAEGRLRASRCGSRRGNPVDAHHPPDRLQRPARRQLSSRSPASATDRRSRFLPSPLSLDARQ